MPKFFGFLGNKKHEDAPRVKIMEVGTTMEPKVGYTMEPTQARTGSTTEELLDRMDSRLSSIAEASAMSDYTSSDGYDYDDFVRRYQQDQLYPTSMNHLLQFQQQRTSSSSMPAVEEVDEEDMSDLSHEIAAFRQQKAPILLNPPPANQQQRQHSNLSEAIQQGRLEDVATESLRAMTLSASLVSEALGLPFRPAADCLTNPLKDCVDSSTELMVGPQPPSTIHIQPPSLMDKVETNSSTWGMGIAPTNDEQQPGNHHQEDNIIVRKQHRLQDEDDDDEMLLYQHDPAAYTRSPRNHRMVVDSSFAASSGINVTVDTSYSSSATSPTPVAAVETSFCSADSNVTGPLLLLDLVERHEKQQQRQLQQRRQQQPTGTSKQGANNNNIPTRAAPADPPAHRATPLPHQNNNNNIAKPTTTHKKASTTDKSHTTSKTSNNNSNTPNKKRGGGGVLGGLFHRRQPSHDNDNSMGKENSKNGKSIPSPRGSPQIVKR